MSGNMSFLNNNSGTNTSNQLQFSGGRSNNGVQGQTRSSLSFRDGSSILSSFVEEEDELKLNLEGYCDKDVWGNRIILSALADAVFSEMPHPKLSPDVIQGLQKFLLSVNVATSACNPFVEYEKSINNTSIDHDDDDANISTNKSSKKCSAVPKLELPRELVEALTPECKIVLKSLVGAYVRKQTEKIREFWKPILEMNGVTVPELPNTSSISTASQRRSLSAAASSESGRLKELFDLILNQTKSYRNSLNELDGEIDELLKKRNEEMKKYERDVNKFKELAVENLKEHKAQENPEFGNKFMDYLHLETERINQQTRLEKLRIEEEERGSEQEQKERNELFSRVKAKFEDMFKETEEMQERLEKYKSLGPEYDKLLQEYKTVDEEVKLKEWVLEQLENGPKDESLFNDSLND